MTDIEKLYEKETGKGCISDCCGAGFYADEYVLWLSQKAEAEQKAIAAMIPEKPKTFEEVKALVESGHISVMLQEEIDGETHFLISDHRRTYEEGEIYEVIV